MRVADIKFAQFMTKFCSGRHLVHDVIGIYERSGCLQKDTLDIKINSMHIKCHPHRLCGPYIRGAICVKILFITLQCQWTFRGIYES